MAVEKNKIIIELHVGTSVLLLIHENTVNVFLYHLRLSILIHTTMLVFIVYKNTNTHTHTHNYYQV